MAIFVEGMKCPLCGQPMRGADRLFGTSHFLGPEHDLAEFSDATMHWDCYAPWEHRARFARLYFEARGAGFAANPNWGVAYADERVLVSVNPAKLVSVVDVMLAETGSVQRVALAEWEDWLAGEWSHGCRHDIERRALGAVLPVLRERLATSEAVRSAVRGVQQSPPDEGGLVGRIMYQTACRDLAERAARKGLACPGCGKFSTAYDYWDAGTVTESGPKSHLTCRSCGKQFGPLDV